MEHVVRAAAAAASGAAKPKINKAARMKHRMESMWYIYVITGGVIFGCAVLYFGGMLRAWLIRRRVAALRKSGVAPTPSTVSGSASASKLPTALRTTLANLAFVRVIPVYLYSRVSLAEWFFTAAYVGIGLGLAVRGSLFEDVPIDIANPFGFVALAQFPLVVALSSRNNIISWMTGIGYEKLNYLHRVSARTLTLCAWVHSMKWVQRGLGDHGPGTQIFTAGVIALLGLTLMALLGWAPIRRAFYEFFIFTHIALGIFTLVGVYFHYPKYKYWVWPAMLLWGLDRAMSGARLALVNRIWLLASKARHSEHSGARIELVNGGVMRITVNRPNLSWGPGQHAFLTMPQTAALRYEAHPFTMANVPSDSGDAVFLVRPQRGFTRRLADRLQHDVTENLNVYIDGPYGISHDMNHYDSVLLLAGGSGVTFGLSHFLSIISASRKGTSAVSRVRLAWNVREGSQLAWIAPLLNDALAAGLPRDLEISVDVYITRSGASAEPEADGEPTPAADANANSDGQDSPAVSSPSGSSTEVNHTGNDDHVNEKKEKSLGQPTMYSEKLAQVAGLTGPAAQVVNFYHGRSHVERILRTDVESSAADAAGVHVAVCGPTSLALDARRAVCRVNSASAVLRGQNPVSFYSETFGW